MNISQIVLRQDDVVDKRERQCANAQKREEKNNCDMIGKVRFQRAKYDKRGIFLENYLYIYIYTYVSYM